MKHTYSTFFCSHYRQAFNEDRVFPSLPDLDYRHLREEHAWLLFFSGYETIG